jgi:LmbE family N-acetylglucosaminyl deacetylase/glycosyltransferase involved in cell wall biosynthesis
VPRRPETAQCVANVPDHLRHHARCRISTGSDRPHRFVCDQQLGRTLERRLGCGFELIGDEAGGPSGIAHLLRLANAKDRRKAGGNGDSELACDHRVGLAINVTPLGVAKDDEGRAAVEEHRRGDLAGESAGRLIRTVLSRKRCAISKLLEIRKRRRDDDPGRGRRLQLREIGVGAARRKVHFPVRDRIPVRHEAVSVPIIDTMVLPESEAIPYEAADLRGERLLVLAPHPDDEVIGCGGLVALHAREQRQIRVIVATDGAEAGEAAVREKESLAALALLGKIECEFLRFPDRRLAGESAALKTRLREILAAYKPDLIAVPNPVEIHPDHAALARAFVELIQQDESLFAALAVARVAFYEVGYPLRPNTLVDITAVADVKDAAIAAHQSQLGLRDYISYARGLNSYRAMTLAPEARRAEGYFVIPLPALRTMPFSQLRENAAAPPRVEIAGEPLPVSVIVRTKDRPALLREAIDSVRATGYPAEIVVVNDGGQQPDARDVRLVNLAQSAGRSEAMNRGVRAAKSAFIAFLDDDDLFYPEHIDALTTAARSTQDVAWYSDAISAFVRTGPSGARETHSRMRIFGQDFDRQLLLIDNYIPLPTLLVSRQTFLDLGGFDPAFDLFEDWDFLIRLSQKGAFAHVPRVTCEIRHIEGAGSITLESPEGSARFRDAKLQIWKKHAALIDENLLADVFEKQKRRLAVVHNDAVDARGLQNHLEVDIARLQREKAILGNDIQALHNRVNEALMRISHLEGANAEIRNQLAAAEADRHEKGVRLKDLQSAHAESQTTNAALFTEVARLQELLDQIFKSRTWKLHEIVERMKGRA